MEKHTFAAQKTGGDAFNVPQDLALGAAYPNPFNPRVNIPFALPEGGQVRMEIFDVMGRHVHTLANGFYAGGDHTLVFDATNLSSGVYLLRAQLLGGNSEVLVHTQRLTLMQ